MSFSRLLVLCATLLLVAFAAGAQSISGIVVDETSNKPVADAIVHLKETGQSTTTKDNGSFKLEGLTAGSYTLVIETELYNSQEISVTVSANTNTDVGTVTMLPTEGINTIAADDIVPTISLSDDDLQSSGSQSVSGLLTASRDVYINTAAYTFGTYRFSLRGYDADMSQVYINGVVMNDMVDGGADWYQWGGLNDVLRNRDNTVGLGTTDYTFGGVGGSSNIDTRASTQWKQLRVSYAAGNRSYRNRLMATYSTGLLDKGWAVSLSASHRWANEGYIPGTFYDAWAYFMAVEKRFGENNSLNLTIFGAPIRRGKMGPAVDEARSLSGDKYYNPNWGYQNGEKRNARVAHSHLPTFLLTHEWKIKEGSRLFTSAQYQFGADGSTALNWYNAPDPRPDYYRNLPSYIDDSGLQYQAQQLYMNNPDLLQVNWDNLYNINYLSTEDISNFNGTGRDTTVNLARYMIEDRRQDKKRAAINIVYENQLSDIFKLTAGLDYVWQRTYNYKLVDDLLGADVFVNLNQFAERDFRGDTNAVQNDLNNPNQLLEAGDRFGYDYDLTVCRKGGWVQGEFSLSHFDFFVAANLSHTRFWRTGNMRNGLFPDDSYGDGPKQSFVNYGVKGGVTYKINGRNYLVANAEYLTRAPFATNSYVSPRTRQDLLDNLTSEEIYSFEGGYLLKAPKVKARAMFYYTQSNNATDSYSLYYDLQRTFINIALSNIDKRYMGGEFAVQGTVYPGLELSAVAGLGQHIYNSRFSAKLTEDNSADVLQDDLTIFSKNFYIANGPQLATTFGISYHSPKSWFASMNFNYFDQIYIDFNPLARTNIAVDLIEPGSETWNKIIDQKQGDGQFTMDFFGGYTWRMDHTFKGMKRNVYMYLTVGVNNLLNNKDFITGGFEQTRLYYEDRTVDRFPPKYFRAYGTTFFIQLSFRI